MNPTLTADVEFRNSSVVTKNLINLIENHENDLCNYDGDQVKVEIARMKKEKEESLVKQLTDVQNVVDEKMRRAIELAGEKGAGAWLTCLPLQSTGYVLNKEDFKDGKDYDTISKCQILLDIVHAEQRTH